MKLLELKIACFLYNQFTNYDNDFLQLYNKYSKGSNLDLAYKSHVKDLVNWLRKWGCRQFKKKNENIAIQSLSEWYTNNQHLIPKTDVELLDYDVMGNKKNTKYIFDKLSKKQASKRKGNIKASIGPVGASKILFALRPKIFAPWDKSIYQSFNYHGSGQDYVNYVAKIQSELKTLKQDSEANNVQWSDLFIHLEKKHSSYPKLVDEYYWVAITHGCNPKRIIEFCKLSFT